MPVVHLYLDESGHSSSHPFVVVAGFIGIAEAWRGFAEHWNAILSEYKVQPPFHMTDFESKHGQFKHWDENNQRRPLMRALLDEICRRHIFLFGAAVDVKWFCSVDWKSGFPGSEPLSDPYYLALQDVIRSALRVCNTGTSPLISESKLAVTLEQQTEFERVAGAYCRANAYFDVTNTLLDATKFEDPVAFPQLQAADIAAFEVRWRITRPDLCRYPWKRLSEKPINIFLRGIDSAKSFPELNYEPTEYKSLILIESNTKRKRNQGRKTIRVS